MYYVGLDIGGTKCAVTLATVKKEPEILLKEKFATNNEEPSVILEKFSSVIEKYKKDYDIGGIGISCGGPLDSKKGIIMSPPSLPKWENIEIVKYFEQRFGIKTYLQNDANACAVAEWKFGVGKGTENMIFLTFGTGLGAGLILNGKLYSGQNDNAGEIGHVRLTKNGPLGYYKEGSCEGYCSGSGMTRLAKIMLKKKAYSEIAKPLVAMVGGVDKITTKDIADLAKQGDKFCKKVFDKSAEMLGRALSILVDLFNPQKIVIGGVFMRTHELLLPKCLKVMKKECLFYSLNVVEVVPAGLGESVGDYSALAVANGEF